MIVGLLYPYNEKQFEKDIKDNKNVTIGIDAEQLLNEINAMEINHQYNLAAVLAQIKQDLMVATGKLEIQEEEESKDEAKNGNERSH